MTGQGKKKAIVILNGLSLKKKILYHEYLPALSGLFDIEVHETLSQNDAKNLASKFTDRFVDVILAAGGDGTLHQVVNGVLRGRESDSKLPTLGVLPIGSSNDFARGAGLTGKMDQLVKIFSDDKPRPIDIGLINYSTEPSGLPLNESVYFVNVADIGMGPEVVRKVLNSGRPFGSELAYYQSILATFLTYRPMVVRATTENWTWEGKVRTLAIANGKYYGHGLCIAPEAVLDDRLFSAFICGNVSVLDFVLRTAALKRGEKVTLDKVWYKTAQCIELSSDKPCLIEGDGEILGWLPATIRMVERRLNFLI